MSATLRDDPPLAPRSSPDAPMGRVARGGALNLGGAVFTGLANFGLAIVLTRGLSKADAGLFFSTSSLFLLAVSVGQLGTNTGLVYFLSRCRALGRMALVRSYVRTAARPVLACGLLAAAALFVLAPEVARLTNPDHTGRAVVYLRALAVFIPVAGLEAVALSATRGLGSMRQHAVVELVGRPALQLLLVATAVFVLSPGALGVAWALAYLPAAVAAWWWLSRLVRDTEAPRAEARVGREFWRFASPRALTSVIQMAMQRLDIVLVGALAGAVPAAIYTAATRFIVVGQMGNNAISTAAQPSLAVSIAERDRHGTNHIYQTSTAWLMALTWPLYLTLALFGGTFLAVFGPGYGSGAPVLVLLSLAMVVATGFGMVDMLLSMAGHTSWNLGNAVLALAVQVALDLVLIPSHGILGAAIGWSASIVTRNAAALLQVGLALRLHPFGPATATSAAVCLAAFGGVAGGARLLLGGSLPACALALALGLVVYAGGMWRFRRTLELESLARLRRGRASASSA